MALGVLVGNAMLQSVLHCSMKLIMPCSADEVNTQQKKIFGISLLNGGCGLTLHFQHFTPGERLGAAEPREGGTKKGALLRGRPTGVLVCFT
jgi:hypothetical protein